MSEHVARDGSWLPQDEKDWDVKAWATTKCPHCKSEPQVFCTFWKWEKPKFMRSLTLKVWGSSHKERIALTILKYKP